MSNMRWELCLETLVYYLKSNMCDYKKTNIGKTVGGNVAGFISRINQHISDCRTGISTCKFPVYTHTHTYIYIFLYQTGLHIFTYNKITLKN